VATLKAKSSVVISQNELAILDLAKGARGGLTPSLPYEGMKDGELVGGHPRKVLSAIYLFLEFDSKFGFKIIILIQMVFNF
jgi:hypothetical protein